MFNLGLNETGTRIGMVAGTLGGIVGGYFIGEAINGAYLADAHHAIKGLVDIIPAGVGGMVGYFGGGFLGAFAPEILPRRRRY